ncbi:SRPBCC family protein [Burkholderia sp. RS01]|uniref:SRPBCC family protein n=1 Tax=unclassified Burkholderia TaxID=2613784 RepID=UPI003218D296
MATVQESIDVNVPVGQAYNQWTQFEDFPRFMSGVDAVRQLDDTTVLAVLSGCCLYTCVSWGWTTRSCSD